MIEYILSILRRLGIYERFLVIYLLVFIVSLLFFKFNIKYLERLKILGKDKHKFNVLVPETGGIGFILSVAFLNFLLSLFFKGFYELIVTIILPPLIIASIFSFDDISIISTIKLNEKGIGFENKILKALLPILASSTLIVYTWYRLKEFSTIDFLIKKIDFGLYYPIFLVPIALIGASNAVNLLGGLNGLEVGLGILYLLLQILILIINGKMFLALLEFAFVLIFLAFLYYNFYPARIFPGDAITYALGSIMAIFAILGKIEFYSVLIFWIYFLEAIIKFYNKIKYKKFPECFAKEIKKIGNKVILLSPERIGSITHIFMKFLDNKATEKNVVLTILAFYFSISFLITLLYIKLTL